VTAKFKAREAQIRGLGHQSTPWTADPKFRELAGGGVRNTTGSEEEFRALDHTFWAALDPASHRDLVTAKAQAKRAAAPKEIRASRRIAAMTTDQIAARNATNTRARLRREANIPGAREARLANNKRRAEALTPEQRELILAKKRATTKKWRDALTPEQHEARREGTEKWRASRTVKTS